MNRREWLATSAFVALQGVGVMKAVRASTQHQLQHGEMSVSVLSDGHLSIPASMVLPGTSSDHDVSAQLLSDETDPAWYTPDCNITLVKTGERTILFDVGAGPYFMESAGRLVESLEALDIPPDAVTDVVFTHAHPDHLWGLTDDFDDLVFPNARYFMARQEVEYWLDDNTLSRTPEARKSFVAGAQNRLAVLSDQLIQFDYGDEIIAGVEAINTSGHTPGHTSFALHNGSDTLVVIGDALAHQFVSFEHPEIQSAMDQDPTMGAMTRQRLLDRLVQDQSLLLGFHLAYPGMGRAERSTTDGRYRFVAA